MFVVFFENAPAYAFCILFWFHHEFNGKVFLDRSYGLQATGPRPFAERPVPIAKSPKGRRAQSDWRMAPGKGDLNAQNRTFP